MKKHIQKNNIISYLFYAYIMVQCFPATAQVLQDFHAADKVCRIKLDIPAKVEDRLMLLDLLQIDHYYIKDGGIISEVMTSDVSKLKGLPFKYKILCDDVEKELHQQNEQYYAAIKQNPTAKMAFENSGDIVDNIIKTPAAFEVKSTLGGYYSYSQMVSAMDDLVATYPTIAQKFSIGKTYQNRDIWCIKISDNVSTDENEPELGYMGLQHAREAIGGASMIFFMQYLCENYSTDARIKALVDNREFFIIPCMNADGWEYNRTTYPSGGGMWRKNRHSFGSGRYGVDLNRNWGYRWADCSMPIQGYAPSCGSSSSSSETYWGPSAFSEPESQAVRDFTKTRHFTIFLDQHAFGPYYSIPPGRASKDALTSDELKFYIELCSAMGKYNGMKYGNSYEALKYEVAGGVKDWMLRGEIGVGTKGKIYGFTGEGGAGGGTSGNNFWPPASKIVILSKGMVYQNLQMAYVAGSYADIQDMGDLNITSTSGNLPYRLRRLGLENKPIKVTAIPLQNITITGSSVTTSLANFNDIYNGNISYTLPLGISAGNVIKYIWKVETEACTFSDTIVKIYNGITVLSDNMEASTATSNWTISSGWAYTNTLAFSGSKSFSESPSGNYGATSTLTAQWKNSFSLSGAGSAYLSFMVRYRAENFCDKMEVQVSTNGGSAWQSIRGNLTIEEPNDWDGSTIDGTPSLTGIHEEWQRAIYNLEDYLGYSNVRFRFRFSSVNTDADYDYNRDEGFNIDDLTLVMGGSPDITLPLELIEFSGHHEAPNNVLNWSTASEKNTSRFEIQRSINGINFETIGTVNAAGNSNSIKNYSFVDEQPYSGENVYRLKMIDQDGSFTYSKMVSIIVKESASAIAPTGIEKMYPNPATNSISIQFNLAAEQSKQFKVLVYDVAGKMMYYQDHSFSSGENNMDLDISTFPAGQYMVSISDPIKRVFFEKKFIKQ